MGSHPKSPDLKFFFRRNKWFLTFGDSVRLGLGGIGGAERCGFDFEADPVGIGWTDLR